MIKKIRISFYYSTLIVFCQLFFGSGVVFAGVNDFYFEDFTADYYLTRDEEGVSGLRVVENLTAVFPEFNQNKGVCRYIPFTNQDGGNITLPGLSYGNIMVLRNGMPEPIYSIEKEKDFYEVCTGDESYVLGEQVYTFSYEFEKVVTEFPEHQELYWDTNGNGWKQKFNSLTARVHIDEDVLDDITGNAWCYVGRYGKNEQGRCEVARTEDGFVFKTGVLEEGENLTFDVEIKSGTFVAPKPEENYVLIYALTGILGVCVWLMIYVVRKYLKNKEKEDYFKGYFVKPEYQPSPIYSLEELSELYMGKKKDVKVAVLLDLIVRKRIELIAEGERKWAFRVLSLDEVGGEEKILLAILNGGKDVEVGDVVSVVSRHATMTLMELRRDFDSTIRKGLVSGKLVEENYVIGESRSGSFVLSSVLNLVITWLFLTFVIAGSILVFAEEGMGGKIILKREFAFLVGVILFITTAVWTFFNNKANRFKNITKRGIEAEKYMEGLELYIRMAEKDRLKFLQSVDGAEVSPKGVVKLYEKLLPYAAVFGLEKSWMEEMKQYCEVEEIEAPNYLATGIAVSGISRAMAQTVDVMNSSTRMASSGGGSSSGFSGGGGGGFSGGGGGGGGGGGR